jgi:lipoprotein-releasing system permease protein
MGTSPRIKAYPVVAIFQIGMSEYDSTYVFMPFTEAQPISTARRRQAVEVYVDDPTPSATSRARIEEAAARPVFSTDWRSAT